MAAVVATAAAVVLIRDGRARFLEILESDVDLFGAMLLKVLAGCLIGAFLTLLLPRDRVSRWVGAESGWLGLVIATVAGAILPGGPLTIYPIASAFLVMGADVGATVAFVTSWTLLGYGRALVWELPFFGPDFVLWRMVAAWPLPLVAGVLARLAVGALGASRRGRP
ncbi:MAG: permease [Dehalococcoidia bacterium]|nr:permease [Dehalococcoidia bacterium]